MRIWLQNFVSIQPRTSLEKSDVSWPTMTTARSRRQARARPSAARSDGGHKQWRCVGHDTSLFSKLVLGCIETKFCNQIRILQQFSKSTKLSSWFFAKFAIFAKFRKILEDLARISGFLQYRRRFFAKIAKKTAKSAQECPGALGNQPSGALGVVLDA